MKRQLSAALTFIILVSCTQGGFAAGADDFEEVVSTQVEETAELASEIDAEGLVIELDEFEAEESAPEPEAEEPVAEEALSPAPCYALISEQTEVCDVPGGSAVVTLEKGGVALVLEASEWTKVAFNTDRGIVTGFVPADRVAPLNGDEAAAFLDELIESGAVALYNDDLDRPLATLDCAFPVEEAEDAEPAETAEPETTEEPAEETDEEAVPETTAEPTEETAAEPSEALAVEPSEEPAAEPSEEPAVEPAEEPAAEPTAEPTIEPTAEPTEEPRVMIFAAESLGSYDKMFAAAGFAIETTASSLKVGDSGTVKAINANGGAISASQLTYASSNAAVAKVSADGVVTACGAGSAIITVTYNAASLTSAVKVTALPAAIQLPAKVTLGVKEKNAKLSYVLVPPTGQNTCDAAVTWSTSNKKVVAIDAKTGLMTAKKKGSATITATTSNGKKASCKITVKKAPGKVTLSPTSVRLSAGGMKFRLTAKLPKKTGSTVTYTSSNTRVATVAADGTITTVAKGSAVITAQTFNGKTARCTVTVTDVPRTATFATTAQVLPATAVFSPNVNVKASDGSAAIANVTYAVSSGADCVKVGSDGTITGVKAGTAVITGVTHNGIRTGNSCTITVVPAPTSVSLSKTKVSLGKGQTFTLTPTLGNVSGAGLTLKWTSSKPKVATVDANGVVTAKAKGTTTITVKTFNGKKAKCKVTVKKAPKKVTLKPVNGSINVGSTAKYTVKLPKGSAGGYTFTSSNTAVATVTNDGVVKGIAAGTVTITVTTHNGKTAKATLTVKGSSSGNSSSSASAPASLEKLGLASYQSTYNANMSSAQKIEHVIYNAQNQLGKPYIYGSGYQTANPNGFDCSGLVYWCYYKIGIKLGNSAYKQGYDTKYAKITSISDLKRGDVVCFNTSSDNDLSDHTGIYLGNGYFIHASSGSSKRKVVVQSFTNDSISNDWYKRHFSWGRRIL